MKSNSEACLAYVLKDEGGYAERNTEGGGAVNMGVTFTVFEAWRKGNGDGDVTFADLKAMGRDEAMEIYRAQYMTGIGFDDLPIGVDYAALDAAVTGGVTGSVKLLQEVLGLKPVDGHYGLVTRWAANHRPVMGLISMLCDARIAKYKTFKRFNQPYKAGAKKTWGDIWTARINAVRKRAIAMVPVARLGKAGVAREMQGLVLRGFTADQFATYLRSEVAPKMRAWRPRGAVLHNTGKMVWPGIANGKSITPQQRLRNMSVDWVSRGFKGGPHLVVAPDGMIWAAWPLWLQGTHSPSYNATFWGIEMVGDFDTETFPVALRTAVVKALAALYAMLGHEPDDATFRLHKEDPRTTHKRCPGKNAGTKDWWLKAIRDEMHKQHPGELPHVA